MPSRAAAFSLTELLVALILVAVVLVIGFSGLQRATRSSKGVRCLQNLRQIAVLFQGYLADRNQTYPHAYTQIGYRFWPKDLMDAAGDTRESLRGLFLCPGVRNAVPAFYTPASGPVDPGNGTYAYVSYAVNAFGVAAPTTYAPGLRPARQTAISEPSKLLLLVDFDDTAQPYEGWYYAWSSALDQNWAAIEPRHGTVNALFCDGHARPMSHGEVTGTNPDYWQSYRYTRP